MSANRCRLTSSLRTIKSSLAAGRSVPSVRYYAQQSAEQPVENTATPAVKSTRQPSSSGPTSISESLASNSTTLKALHSRLKLNQDYALSTLARSLICHKSSEKYADNTGLSAFGRSIISFYIHEYFIVKYPRIPPSVLRHAVDLYSGVTALSQVADLWGIQPDTRPALARILANETEEDLIGRLRFLPVEEESPEPGVTKISSNTRALTEEAAKAAFVRALVGGMYAHNGLAYTRTFIHNYIIGMRHVDMSALMKFDQPTRELSVLCDREGLQSPVSRLLVETGRYSSAPVFVVGVFSGEEKLGEGQGSSLREARTRAAVNALKSWYLYTPVDVVLPSDDQEFKPAFVDSGVVIV